VNNLF